MTNTSWLFPENKVGRWEGINNGDAEHFLKNPIGSLAREVIQNSLDARVGNLPVVVQFEEFSIDAHDFPNIAQLKQKIRAALLTPKNQTDNRTNKNLSEAEKILEKNKISILKISESNTAGMMGPADDDSSPFFAYTKGSGLTGKTDGLGSFGIGKKAPVVNSALRTTFVSTVYEDPHFGEQLLCQGMSFWVTHKEGDAKFDGLGYWGVRNASPITDKNDLPEWLTRQTRGTNIYIAEPILPKFWQELLTGAVLTNFFAAINNGDLEVVAGRFSINKQSIDDLYQNNEIRNALNSLDDEQFFEGFKASYNFYKAYSDPQAIVLQTQVQAPIGNFEIKLLVADDLPKQVGFLRNGMFIVANDLPALRRFQNTKEFVAVAYCTNKEGNTVLREMEPPQHNAFEGTRYDRENGPRLLKSLGKKIRDQMMKYIEPEYADISSVNFLADLFGYESDDAGSNSGPTDINPDGRISLRLKAVAIPSQRKKTTQITPMGDMGGFDPSGEDETEVPGGGVTGKGKKPGDDGEGGAGGQGEVETGVEKIVNDPRVIYMSDGVIQTHFSIDHKGEVLLKFFVSGADADELAEIESTNIGSRFNGGIKLSVNGPDDRVSLKVRLDNVTNEAIVINAYEI